MTAGRSTRSLIAGSLVRPTLAGCGSVAGSDPDVATAAGPAPSAAPKKAALTAGFAGLERVAVEYSADSAAGLYAHGDQQLLHQEINPGNTAKGRLVFDVPAGTKLTSLELHDSVFSGGVTVALK